MVPFSNGRHEGANPSSRVIIFPGLESQTLVVDQLYYFKLGISVPNLKTCISGDRSHPYRKDQWRLHFHVCDHPSRAGNRYDTFVKDSNPFQIETLNLHSDKERHFFPCFEHFLA